MFLTFKQFQLQSFNEKRFFLKKKKKEKRITEIFYFQGQATMETSKSHHLFSNANACLVGRRTAIVLFMPALNSLAVIFTF